MYHTEHCMYQIRYIIIINSREELILSPDFAMILLYHVNISSLISFQLMKTARNKMMHQYLNTVRKKQKDDISCLCWSILKIIRKALTKYQGKDRIRSGEIPWHTQNRQTGQKLGTIQILRKHETTQSNKVTKQATDESHVSL